ncbi:hypothetical protein [Clostridium cellulovorans]|uniref:Uncharacterized protein n=1 Tax=Clostridium cellulovorans (strain ATCC 35296 / DSM 3052 / OCM 3 / 743B) TaxID=573061 RepID=D9SQS8_CLOC7|nr:hypothetical protein [Clostridium cellulovorans]ADL52284.1 hypothetical protein Clocel_2572 [Clostridium cellulovorans 743B]
MKKVVLIILTILILAICILVIFYGKRQGIIVGRYVTNEHYRYSPVELNGDIYFPSNYDFKDNKELKSIGHLGVKDKRSINDILLDVGEILVEKEDRDHIHFTVIDDNPMSYSKVNYLQDLSFIKSNIDKYNSFVLCNDRDTAEARIIIEKDVIVKLQETFGTIKYNKEDFNNCDDIYYI